ncbi:MAG: glycosyltransferase family 2 protein [Sulfuricurvum sp.]|uniref:glycosyltransferase family 2 protein n=1 Tax=Sulfuricurvum sp. TaxID=2025608 RepID=UPI002634C4CA|nr:glycosyltransferase family 2 protein [Sulfuricurvum sp.]MDD2828646.1 glycosyltransferase family 2 protein [Sulfuricurvum sp.]MDD4948323.1 glycosyltransferase family 2 protein [Sulfuricurvum sp.]
MKCISIMTACYNEEENIAEVYAQVKAVFETKLPEYYYEHVFIDNASEDTTVEILRGIAANDSNVKVIVNARNFGHIRSPFHGLMQCSGDAVISIVADLQDPPEMIVDFVRQWEAGYKIVIGVKEQSYEAQWMFKLREAYYNLLHRLSEVEIFKGFTGFGLYDKKIIDFMREFDDPYPFFRGLIAEIGFKAAKIPYTQPARPRGISKNNFYTLYDMGILGIINNSKVPLRIATFLGFLLSFVSFMTAIIYTVVKLFNWNSMPLGIAPLIIGSSFMFGIVLFFLGIIGEYIGAIYTQILKRPRVFESERINFKDEAL